LHLQKSLVYRVTVPSVIGIDNTLVKFLKFLLATLLLSLLALSSLRAQDGDYLAGPPQGDEPLEVRIGLNLVNITDVNEKEETIDFEGALYLEWVDVRLAYDPAAYGMPADWQPRDYSLAPRQIYQGNFAFSELYAGWWPSIVIPNGVGNRQVTEVALGIWPDGRVLYHDTFFVRAEVPMDLRLFPFDRQSLEIFMHPFLYGVNEVVLVPDERLVRTWDQNMGIADWSRKTVTMAARKISVAKSDGDAEEISEVVVTINIERRPLHFMLSLVFPMVLLVSLTWCVFWMEESLSSRVNVTFIGILSVIAYYFVIIDFIPSVSYLTLVDGFIVATFLILAAGVVLATIMEVLGRAGRTDLGRQIDLVCRWAFPLTYVVFTVLLSLLFFYLY